MSYNTKVELRVLSADFAKADVYISGILIGRIMGHRYCLSERRYYSFRFETSTEFLVDVFPDLPFPPQRDLQLEDQSLHVCLFFALSIYSWRKRVPVYDVNFLRT